MVCANANVMFKGQIVEHASLSHTILRALILMAALPATATKQALYRAGDTLGFLVHNMKTISSYNAEIRH